MRELALFAGSGGGILGGVLLGWRTVAAVEKEESCIADLLRRQADGCLPRFGVWDDITTFDGTPFRGGVDVITGGFPCQDISVAGKGASMAGARSGLWSEMARVIGEVKPRWALVENSPALTGRGLDRVLMDLAALGYDAEWDVFGAYHVGAPHRRERIWILAHTDTPGQQGRAGALERQGETPRFTHSRCDAPDGIEKNRFTELRSERGQWPVEPDVGRVAHGVARRVDRLRAIGNGQVPRVAAFAFATLIGRF